MTDINEILTGNIRGTDIVSAVFVVLRIRDANVSLFILHAFEGICLQYKMSQDY